jgi:endoglucanase
VKRSLVAQVLLVLALSLAAFGSVSPPASSAASGEGYWHTSGNRLLDQSNLPVKPTGVNWSGFETANYVPGGLAFRSYRDIIDQVAGYGYNCLRLPLSNEMVESNPVPDPASLSANADLQGLHSLDILDRIVSYAGQSGLKIVLNNHRSNAGNGPQESGLWYTEAYPESAWLNDWKVLAERYKGNPTVIGFDLRDEPHTPSDAALGPGADWGSGNPATDWRLAAERAGEAVLSVNPNLLILVEGISRSPNDSGGFDYTWWGGDLQGVAKSPVRLSVPGRLVYSPHDYGPDLSPQAWFDGGTSYDRLVGVWTKFWAYIGEYPATDPRLAPLWIGEFGVTSQAQDLNTYAPGSEGQWFSSLLRFLDSQGNIGWTYWTINGDDHYALLSGDYGFLAVPVKQQILARAQGIHYLPVVQNNANGQTTTANLFNPAAAEATATVSYFDSSGQPLATRNVTIPAQGSLGLSAGDGTLPGGFWGTAVVQSPYHLIVTTTSSGGQTRYLGPTSAYNQADLSLALDGAQAGHAAALALQNPGAITLTGSVQFLDGAGNVVGTTNFSLTPHGSQTLFPANGLPPLGFVGTARVRSSAPLVALVT